MKSNQVAIIVGAGPAGLTAAYELARRTDIKPVVLEMSDTLGGLARTVNYKGNRIDIGPHRFFSKSDRVMEWWLDLLPLEPLNGRSTEISYQGKRRNLLACHSDGQTEDNDNVMLLRSRRSRIYFLRKFFDYPITLNGRTLANLGPIRIMRVGLSYLWAKIFPIRNEQNLEQFFINRFGRELYLTFFKAYTEKVWGIPCEEISAEWGAQRIKGLNVGKAVIHALQKVVGLRPNQTSKAGETSLIEQFLYPKLGAGQMWQLCAGKVRELGGEIHCHVRVDRLLIADDRVTAIEATDLRTGQQRTFHGDHFISTMPVKHLMRAIGEHVPENVRDVSEGLVYRDFIMVGVLLSEMNVDQRGGNREQRLDDNWIYIQEGDVRVGRLTIYNNFSPEMVADPATTWIGLEYFCNKGEELWEQPDAELKQLAVRELEQIGIIDQNNVLDSTVIRMPKAYPAYFGTYDSFDTIRQYTDGIENLFLLGRNGMHRYNNQDHSMLAAMTAVDNIVSGQTDKANIWEVNAEQEYHEQKTARPAAEAPQPVSVASEEHGNDLARKKRAA